MFTVSKLAKLGKVTPHTVRHYAKIGILHPTRHPNNDYQLFSEKDLQRLRFINQAKQINFTLSEVMEIFKFADEGQTPCPEVKALITKKVEENRQRIEDLRKLQVKLEGIMGQWQQVEATTGGENRMRQLIESLESLSTETE